MLDANGVKLHVREWPKADAPVVLMVHGYPDASHVWDRCAPLLAKHFHVVAYDVRGAGQSQAFSDASRYAITELMADFKAVIDDISPTKAVHVLAHDWGSIQCWDAVTDPAFAHRIASYTSISGPSLDHAGAWLTNTLRTSPIKGLPKVLRQVANSWYILAFHLPLLAPLLWKTALNNRWHKLLKRAEGIEAPAAPSQLADGLQGINLYRANILSHVFKPQPRKTTVPVQLLVPTNDRFVSPRLFDDLPQWAPRLWRFNVEGSHWLPLGKPQLVADKVQTFVEFIESGKADEKAPLNLRRAQTRATEQSTSDRLYGDMSRHELSA